MKRLHRDFVEPGVKHRGSLVDDLQERIHVKDQLLLGDTTNVYDLRPDLDVVDPRCRGERPVVRLDGDCVLTDPLDARATLAVDLREVAVGDDGSLVVVSRHLIGSGRLALEDDRLLGPLAERKPTLDVGHKGVSILGVLTPVVPDLLDHAPLQGFSKVGEQGESLPVAGCVCTLPWEAS